MKIQPQTLNATQAAKYLGISRPYFYELYNAGAITAVIFSRKHRPRFLIRDLEQFLLSCRHVEESQKRVIYRRPQIKTKDPKLQKILDKYK